MSDDDWDNDDWDAPDLSTIAQNNFADEEDLSLVEEAPKPKVVRQATEGEKAKKADRQKRQAVIDKKEAQEQERQARLKAALEAVSKKSGRNLTDKEKQQLIVEKSDNLLCEDLFGDLGVKPTKQDEVVLEGEDLMGGEDKNNTAAVAAVAATPTNPKEAFENAVANLPLNNEIDHIEAAGFIAARLNQGKNSTDIVQFLEFLIKAAHSSLDSTQFKALASACNVQKNLKQKEEQVGKKKKKKSKKKVLKTQRDDDFMAGGQYEDYGGYDDFM